MSCRSSNIHVESDQDLLAYMHERLDYDAKLGAFYRKAGFTGVRAGDRLGAMTTGGKLQAAFLGERYEVAHLVWLWETGELPRGRLYRVNGDPADDRFVNLECSGQGRFLEKASERHPDLDYTRVRYEDASTPVEIGCREHGFSWRKPEDILASPKGCAQCGVDLAMVRADQLRKTPEERAEIERLYRQRPEVAERNRIRCRAKYKRDPEKHIQATKASIAKSMTDPAKREAFAERARVRNGAYRATPKGQAAGRLARLKRRARLKDLRSPGVTPEQWEAICHRYTDPAGDVLCAYCKCKGANTVDHVYPISRGGLDEARNVVPACGRCNSSKCNRLVTEWARARELLTPTELAGLAAITY